ncbi:hypothetical protein [Nocardia otitidiscaviarum]|uniref:hypothetical protein n=1 Tax=Nocardia otitidiscaviarum TaxID=1823 RepID=UPI0018941E1A|nr:hypothetical protein [Nocardia otitidiscaviarum]MBF6177291.1 hypothetical protein [Nocardia otitidiscaviarum]
MTDPRSTRRPYGAFVVRHCQNSTGDTIPGKSQALRSVPHAVPRGGSSLVGVDPAGWLAVDFGRSYIAAALADDYGQPHVLPLSDAGHSMPAAVFVKSPARIEVGDMAVQHGTNDAVGFIAEPRSWIDAGHTTFQIGAGVIPAPAVFAAILAVVVERAQSVRAGRWPAGVVLIHPQSWSAHHVGILIEAAVRVGFPQERIRVAPEPRTGDQERQPVVLAVMRSLASGSLDVRTDLSDAPFQRGPAADPGAVRTQSPQTRWRLGSRGRGLLFAGSAAAAVAVAILVFAGGFTYWTGDTDTAFETIALGQSMDRTYVAVHPETGLVYATNESDQTVSVVDPVSSSVTATIRLSDNLEGLAIDPELNQVYVVGRGGTTTDSTEVGTLSIIDTTTNQVTATIPTGKESWGVAVDPVTHNVYVTSVNGFDDQSAPNARSTLSVIDPVSAEVKATIPVGRNAMDVSIDPETRSAYVVGSYYESHPGTVTKGLVAVDLETNRVRGAIAGPDGTHLVHIAVDPQTRTAYATGRDKIAVFDLANNTMATVLDNSGHGGIVVDSASHTAYAVSEDGPVLDSILVIDTQARAVTTRIERVGETPDGLAFDPKTRTLYAKGWGELTVIPR